MEIEIVKSNRKSFALEIKNNKLIVRAPLRATKEQIKAFVEKNRAWIDKHAAAAEARRQKTEACAKLTPENISALYEAAKKTIPERVAYYAPLVGVRCGTIYIKCQRTRWGSCSSKGNLNFNCLLMLAPPEVLDSVVVHELCHLKQMNHSQEFYDEVLRVFPDYRKCAKWLKENGPVLMAMAGK